MIPSRIQLSRKSGWRLPEGALSVARPHQWGNPYPTKPGAQTGPGDVLYGIELSLMLFREHVGRQVAAGLRDLADLKGYNLACWCRPHEPCHADILIELAN